MTSANPGPHRWPPTWFTKFLARDSRCITRRAFRNAPQCFCILSPRTCELEHQSTLLGIVRLQQSGGIPPHDFHTLEPELACHPPEQHNCTTNDLVPTCGVMVQKNL